ncbi:Protein indeterminate-domain 2 [Vitis vinifera]|uniref:Protein indeterminate-domain 2 n=1 Tax=Vitis vinifera TaxID=29760 RepID=A0A438HF64_VITVI|nr:Protein indeterminate-domain 2 [Vitis vinifera]
MSNITAGDGGSFSSGTNGGEEVQQQPVNNLHGLSSSVPSSTSNNSNGSISQQQPPPAKKKRNLPGNPGELINSQPYVFMNLYFITQARHNLPWKLRQRSSTEIRKRVYVCPEPSCVHHNPARALGDLTGIKKHFCRKHGEKKWKCDKCSKKYAVQSDWKAHSKTCGTREYKCDCGTIFSRLGFCDALAEENTKVNQGLANTMRRNLQIQGQVSELLSSMPLNNNPNSTMGLSEFTHSDSKNHLKTLPHEPMPVPPKPLNMAAAGMFSTTSGSLFGCPITASSPSSSSRLQLSTNSSSPSFENGQQLPPPPASTLMSATALLQKAAQMGATASTKMNNSPPKGFVTSMAPTPFGGILLQKNSSSNDHHLQADPTQFLNQFFYQNDGAESEVMSEMGMFSGLFDQNHGLFKNMEHHEHSNSNNILAAKTTNPGLSSTPRNGKTDTMTVDFWGSEEPGLGISMDSSSSSKKCLKE